MGSGAPKRDNPLISGGKTILHDGIFRRTRRARRSTAFEPSDGGLAVLSLIAA
jgi:hypothetical protein